jgi:endonuclease YncB( thermonuclease family)
MALRVFPLVLAVLASLGLGYWAGRQADPAARTEAATTEGATAATVADVAGPLRVIDGDTFDVAGTRIRLHGVDAPETAQTCLDEEGADWACGRWSLEEARAAWDGQEVACEVLDTDRYGRSVSRCAVGGQDLGAALVSQGMAVAYVAYSEDYLPEQERAHAARLGLWRGSFDMPWDWRAARRDSREAPEVTIEDVAAVSSDNAACAIKGNISGGGASTTCRAGRTTTAPHRRIRRRAVVLHPRGGRGRGLARRALAPRPPHQKQRQPRAGRASRHDRLERP